ncbi:PilL N-terminal domain-containing protein [Methyloversatilis discipulorum]|uniref:PFGI-1 class ICE element type IV pilus protein PilL2 n=1 Tax=Methyloversatilis discipulorum TaxID=1119528 RepID=UPI003F404CDC
MPTIRLRYPTRHRALVAGLLTAVLTAGCATSSVAPSAVAPEPEARAHPVPNGWIPVARYGRYTLVELTPEAAQHDLLLQVIDVSVPPTLPATVGEALRYVLLRSGYTLCETDPEATTLYGLPLPAAHLQLGPLFLRDALLTLAGPAWELQVDDTARQVCFVHPSEPLP